MGRFHSYLNNAVQILDQYKGKEPFASFLKKYFAQHKKFGSKDRKQISHLCYCYFRLGKSLMEIPIEERIWIGLFLCSNQSNETLKELKPEWNAKIDLTLSEKILMINDSLFIADVFPWKEQLSEGIDYEDFCKSFFVQPDLYLRLRPGFEIIIKGKLSAANILFKEINSFCLALPNNSRLENILELDKEAVVQDYNSQKTREYLELAIANCELPIDVWDCCAGSGGKSLLVQDINPNISLTVSDVRKSILVNLKQRFKRAGIKNYQTVTADLSSGKPKILNRRSDIIICDAPCTGSGTWSRTPEQLFYFDKRKIEQYALLQKKIVSNVVPHLKQGGQFIYITCSVFKKENEEIVDYILQRFNLELIRKEVLKGYDKKADSMFIALFRQTL